ncbi:hypothetical protein HAX54_052954 [Datura stramonium]|uniref:Uncharacterized protein n=1 Tax=Datura stramonium TaxID=4076 RepID=A0ABS8T0Q4_DATST|nr:hypothetical protein [Datura stramonium]
MDRVVGVVHQRWRTSTGERAAAREGGGASMTEVSCSSSPSSLPSSKTVAFRIRAHNDHEKMGNEVAIFVMTRVISANAALEICESGVLPGPPCNDRKPWCFGDCQKKYGQDFTDAECVFKGHDSVCVCFYKSEKPCPPH